MTRPAQSRILRNYRNLPPSAFYGFNQKITSSLVESFKIPASTWGANPDLLTAYFAASEKHATMYHKANYRSVLDIAERDALQAQLVSYLDEIAADLEAEAVRNPELLLSCGFDLAKERRSSVRKRTTPADAERVVGEHQGTNP